MKKYKVVGLPKMQNGGPGDKKDPDNFTNEELTDYGNMQINVGDSDQGYYGDKHRQRTNKIYTSLNQLKKLFTEGQLNAVNGEWDYDNQIDAQGIYDDESENLIKRYQGLEDLMKLNFGDRKGDPTRAVDWMNKDGRRYRKSLRALESDIQDLYLRRMEQYGKNTGVTKYDKDGIKAQFTRSPLDSSKDADFISKEIAEKGYVPKQYSLDFQDAVVYAKDRDKERQEKLTAEAERLFIAGAEQGYLPSSVVPIGGKIEDLRSFIKDQKKNLRKYSKNRDLATIQKQKDAEFLNVSADLLGTVEGEKLVRERLKTASDEDQRFLVNLYQKYFSDYDPNAVQFTQEEVNEMQEGFKGKARGSKELDYMSLDNPTGVIQDIAAATAYTAPAIATGQAFLNPTIQNILTPYFFYEAVKDDGVLDKAVDEFSKGEYWDGTVDAGFGLLDVFAFKGLVKTLKTPGAVTRFFSKLKSKNLPKGYLEKINNSLPPMLQLDNIDDVPRNLNLPSATRSVKNTSNKAFADIIPGMDDADIPLDVNEALVKLTDEQFKQVAGTDKWVYQMLVDQDPASAARTFKAKVDNAGRVKGIRTINSAESFAKVADEGKMPFTDIVKIKTAANEGRQKAIDWVSSDQFIQRVMDSRGVSREKAELIQMEFLNNIENIPFELKAYDPEARVKAVFTSEAGQHIIRAHAPKVEGFDSNNIRQLEDLTGSIQHEYLHAANLASGENMKGIEFLPDLKAPEGAKPIVRKNIAYLNQKPEQQVRAVKAIQLAQQAGVIKANEKFTVDNLNKLRDYIEEEGWLFGVAGYGDLSLLLDPIKSGNTFKDKDIVNLLNTAYQYALPLIGGAGAAMLSDSDEDIDGAMMAALPLMIFGRGKKINLKNVYKNIANWFKTVPALKNVPFKQSELQSSVLKNLPAKFKKEFGPDVTFEQLVKEQPEMLKNLIVEHIVDRYEYYESNIPGIPTKRRVTERELPIFYAEQDEAAQFALDFNTAWMEGSLDPRSKELIKPVKDGIKEARELEEEIVSLKPLYDDAIKEVRDGIQNDWNRKVIFPGSMGPMSDAASKEEAVKIGKDLLKVYKDAAAKVVGTENHGNYDVLIKDLEDDIAYIAQMGVDKFRKLDKHNTVYSFTEFQAEEFISANSDIVYDYHDMVDRKIDAYDKVKNQIDAIGPVENVLAPDIAERVNALRGNVQDILDTSKAVTLDARGGVNKESVDGDIISGLVEGRYSESDLKGTVGESMKGDYQGFYGVKSTTNKGNVGQITKRGLPANSDNLDQLYTMYEKGLFGDKLKGLVVRQEDTLRQPIDVAGTMAHEDKHIYQSLIGYLDPHVESQIYGYNVADQKSDLGKAIQEVLIEPKKIDDPTANVDAGDTYTDETYQASPIEVDANLQKERVKYAYKKFQEIMNADNPVSKFRKLKESAGSDARYQKAVIEEIVRVMKIPENKAQFIEDLMSSPIGNAVNQHFKEKYKGVIDPLTDDTKTMAGKEMARQFLQMLPALLIGAGLAAEVSNDESPEELMTAGGQIKRKLKRPNPQFEELELTKEEALAYAQKGYIVEEIG